MSAFTNCFGADFMAEDITYSVLDALDDIVEMSRERALVRWIDQHYAGEIQRINAIWRGRIDEVNAFHARDRAAMAREMQALNCLVWDERAGPRVRAAVDALSLRILGC
jgi:hypothetical protein